MTSVLFHIIGSADWDEARTSPYYEPASLRSEGFIHLSKKEQILRPAHLLYAGRTDLLLLVIDADALTSKLVWEPGSHGEAEHFPHLYGALDVDAVERWVDFPCDAMGTFELPDDL